MAKHPDYDDCDCPDTLAHRAAVRAADLAACRHGRPECECQTPRKLVTESSGRWDASGSLHEAVIASRELAFNWASSLPLESLHWAITTMASDTNAFSLYERKALLEIVALRLGNNLRKVGNMVSDSRTLVSDSDTIHRVILGQCYRAATESPDTSTQLGAVIVSEAGVVKYPTMSYNGFVQGWKPTVADFERPRKYAVTEHAERRAIYKAARAGVALEGATLYATWAACTDCARAIVESGVSRLVRHHPPLDEATERWLESVAVGDEILVAGGVDVVEVIGAIPEAFPILRGGELFDPAGIDSNGKVRKTR